MTELQPWNDSQTEKSIDIPNPDNDQDAADKRIKNHKEAENEAKRQDREREQNTKQKKEDKDYKPVDAA